MKIVLNPEVAAKYKVHADCQSDKYFVIGVGDVQLSSMQLDVADRVFAVANQNLLEMKAKEPKTVGNEK